MKQLTPEQKIKREMLLCAIKFHDEFAWEGELTADNIDEAYETVLVDADADSEFECEFRVGDFETNIPPDTSRHYSSKSVAMQLTDGTWIGWTYWYGGGKHGEPGSIDWMNEAYELTCVASSKVVTVREFKKVDDV